ncbi:MAG: hypothetical protein RLZZ597_2705 [Cyanobacteriota bacterium]
MVRAIVPRRLFQLQPQQVVMGQFSSLDHLRFGNWHKTPQRKGQLSSVLVQDSSQALYETIRTLRHQVARAGDRLSLGYLVDRPSSRPLTCACSTQGKQPPVHRIYPHPSAITANVG